MHDPMYDAWRHERLRCCLLWSATTVFVVGLIMQFVR